MPDIKAIAGTIIRDDIGRYLLVQEKNPLFVGLWGFPGGHVDEGETNQQAAIRETAEEVGLIVELTDQNPVFTAELTRVERVYYAYLATIVSGEIITQPKEIMDAKWLTIAEVIDLDSKNKTREPMILQAVLAVEKS